jgi:DNA-binding SARP family transcriptional activator
MEYRVLGPLEVREGDQALRLGGRKQRALLALLVLNANRVVSRERLIDELWGDDPPATAVASLQVYVSRLRKVLGPKVLVTRAPGYVLWVGPGELDLEKFERLRGSGRAGEALALWRGPALAEFSEPFAQVEAARLEGLRLAALEQRIDAELERGLFADSIAELEPLVAEHPHRERFRAQLMLALYRDGRQAEALEAYRQAREALDELGIEPSDELRRLERSILMHDAALIAQPQLVPEAPGLPGRLALRPASPFVGREREVALLGSLVERAEAGEGQVVLLAGEAGSRKSRLARELAEQAASRGALVLYGSCDPIVNAPYQPFVEALRFLARASDPEALEVFMTGSRSELERLLPSLGRAPTDVVGDPESARQRLHAAVTELFAEVCRSRMLVLILDDIHWGDAPSLHLLRDVVRGTPEARLLLLATYRDRSEDVTPDFSEALAALLRTDGIARLTIGGLSSGDVARFIRRSTGAGDASSVAAAVHALTDGTPFLLCELWRSLMETDAVETSDGAVRLTRPLAELASPQSVRDVTHHRLSRLAASTTAMLELAATVGPQFELRVIEEATSDEGVVSALEEAMASGTIQELPGAALSYRFSHELVRRALYDRLSALRRAELHLHVAEALERVHGAVPDQVLPELAHHFTIGAPLGGGERAVDYNLRAAEAAVSLFALAQAADFATAALAHAERDSLAWARGQYLLAAAEVDLSKEGASAHATAAAVAFVALGDVEAAAEAQVLAARSLRNQRRGAEADAATERAADLVRDAPASRAKADALVSWAGTLNNSKGRFREALDNAREALVVAEELGIVPLQAYALNQIGNALGSLGKGWGAGARARG